MKFGRVYTDFWPDTASWEEDERLMALYLLTCPHRKTEGLFRLPAGYAAADMSWDQGRVERALELLQARGWAMCDAGWTLIVKALRWESPRGPKQVQGAVAAVSSAPRDGSLWRAFVTAAERYAPDFAAALDTPSKGYRDATGNPSDSSTSISTSSHSQNSTSTSVRATAPQAVRSALVAAGFPQLLVDESDAGLKAVVAEFSPPGDVDWHRVGQDIRGLRERGVMRTDKPASALRFVMRGMKGLPRVGQQQGGSGVSEFAKAKETTRRLMEREAANDAG